MQEFKSVKYVAINRASEKKKQEVTVKGVLFVCNRHITKKKTNLITKKRERNRMY